MPTRNPEVQKAIQKRYRLTHKQQASTYRLAYRALHIEAIHAYEAAYRVDHQRERRANWATWWTSHCEERRISTRKWRQEHREAVKSYNAAYSREHPEADALRKARREARKRGLPDTLTLAQWDAIKIAYGFKCAYCGKKPKMLTQDHVIPLVRGGGTTPDNIVPACRGCNSAKRDRSPITIPAIRLLL